MLISNADDFGMNEVTTRNILRCHETGAITAASAMVFMKDSENAARTFRSSALDMGLHLNLTSPFTGSNVPPDLAEHHARVLRFLKKSKYNLILYNPYLADSFRRTVNQQYEEFIRLYGAPPSHLDGHHHMHLSTNVLVARLLPKTAVIRRNFSFSIREKGLFNKAYRSLVDRVLSSRHQMVDYFFSIEPLQDSKRLTRIFELAEKFDVELMSHPERPAEFSFLNSPDFASRLKGVRVGSFLDRKKP